MRLEKVSEEQLFQKAIQNDLALDVPFTDYSARFINEVAIPEYSINDRFMLNEAYQHLIASHIHTLMTDLCLNGELNGEFASHVYQSEAFEPVFLERFALQNEWEPDYIHTEPYRSQALEALQEFRNNFEFDLDYFLSFNGEEYQALPYLLPFMQSLNPVEHENFLMSTLFASMESSVMYDIYDQTLANYLTNTEYFYKFTSQSPSSWSQLLYNSKPTEQSVIDYISDIMVDYPHTNMNRILRNFSDDNDTKRNQLLGLAPYIVNGNDALTAKYSFGSAFNLRLAEHFMYGSSRLGSIKSGALQQKSDPTDTYQINKHYSIHPQYELTDHLGNVRTVVAEKRFSGASKTSKAQPSVLEYNDYFPFGMLIPERYHNHYKAEVNYFTEPEQREAVLAVDFGTPQLQFDFSSRTEVDQWYAQEYYSFSGPNLTDIMGIGLVPIVNNYQGETVVGYDQSLNAQAGKTLQELYFGRTISYAPSNPNGTDTLEIQLDILGDPSLLSAQLVPVGGGKTQILQLPTALNTTTYTTMKCTVVVRGDFDLLFTMRKTRGSALLMLKNLTFTRLRTLSYLPSEEIVTQDVEYRYGFGGHEKDDEIKGSGNHLAFGDYGYDPRLGRRWNIDPMAHEMPGISPYTAFFNNPIIIQDPTGEFGIAGFLIGFAVDVGVQMLANSLAGKPITDIDYGDAFVSGLVGMVTGGMGNVGKLGRSAQKLLTAAGIEGKVASSAMKISAVVTEEGIKASIDIKVATEEGEYVNFKTVLGEGEFAKSGEDAATDFVIGTTMEVFKGGVKDVFETLTTTTLKKEEKALLRKFKQTATGSKNNLKYEAEMKQVGEDINFQETMSEYGAGAAKDISGEQIKEKLD